MYADDSSTNEAVAGLLRGAKPACGCGTCSDCSGGVSELDRMINQAGPVSPGFNFLAGDKPHAFDRSIDFADVPDLAARFTAAPAPKFADPEVMEMPPIVIEGTVPDSMKTPSGSSSTGNGGSGSGVDLSQIIRGLGTVTSNLLGNQGVHPATPIPPQPYQPVIAPEPGGDFFGTIAYAPVRVRGTTMDLEPDPTQWFARHPVLVLVLALLIVYVLFLLLAQAKK